MKQYKLTNNITGWVIFLIAAYTYLSTIEPTASLWDCGEFIASAYKLEVGHPPGAPFFMLTAKFFSLFAKDVTQVAAMVNAMSALASAFTILFLFWSITYLAKKILLKNEEDYSLGNIIAVMGAGSVGALAYTFSDTFWFSAVEGEVYASSSLFTALVFWAILKWEAVADEKYANRWLVLIAYLMGLSIGVHLLNLLAIPAIVLVYYFKKYTPTRKGIIYSLLISGAILMVVMYGIIQGLVKFATWFELTFVNGFGLPFNSGVIFYALLLVSGVVYGLYYSYKHQKVIMNTIFLCFTVILIGYSSFSLIVIRSLADPPMDENDPSNVFNMLAYLNREQYGDRPLLYGPYYNAPMKNVGKGNAQYAPVGDKYEITGYKPKYEYDDQFMTIFPRMHSTGGDHVEFYQTYVNKNRQPISVVGRDGELERIVKPSFIENLTFFFDYQVGQMYLRYFMWNFAGRQDDIQADGSIFHGNWMSGIKFIDEMFLGPQDHLPKVFANHKARNKYYMLPLLFGLLGLMFHLEKHKKDFWIVLSLFFLTGLAIILYLNQTPYQPRERDYAYAGSFYAFCIWIGFGVLFLYDAVSKYLKAPAVTAILMTLISILAVPAILAKENWDDHDRSGRFATRDIAYNYLNSCAPNALLMTNGDNDTFPLWYAQEVEGIRTDVRVVNLMLLNTDWYIDQMNRKAYESDRLPISVPREKYLQGKREYLPLIERITDRFTPLKDAVEFGCSDSPATTVPTQDGDNLNYIPTKMFSLNVDTAALLANGTVKQKDKNLMVSRIEWKMNESHVLKSDFIMMDVLANNNWKRPVYYVSLGHSGTLGLDRYMQLEGLAYRLVPIRTEASSFLDVGRIDTDIMYDNLMNKFMWRGMSDPDVYLDHFHLRTLMVIRLRNNFARLAEALIAEHKNDSALKVLDRCLEIAPVEKIPYDFYLMPVIEGYLKLKAYDKADKLISGYSAECNEMLVYMSSLKGKFQKDGTYEIRKNLQILNNLRLLSKEYNREQQLSKVTEIMTPYSAYIQEMSQEE